MLLVLSPKTKIVLKKLHLHEKFSDEKIHLFYCKAVSILLTQHTQ